MGQGIVKSRGGCTSKIHVATDKNGKAMRVFITGGNIYDSTRAEKLLYDTIHEGVHVLEEKAFDFEQIIKYIEKSGAISVIPPRKNRTEQREYHKDIYKNRNQIERFFNRLKQFRRIATRYDKLLFSLFIISTTCCSFHYNTEISLNCCLNSSLYLRGFLFCFISVILVTYSFTY